jgi:hypothetical protein
MRIILALIPALLANMAIAQFDYCLGGRYGEQAIFDSSEVVVLEDIQYGNATHLFTGNEVDLMLDVWMPDPALDTEIQRPMLLLIHGGSFMAGSRADMNYYCMEFARRGYVVATASYRLGWGCDPNAGIFTCLVCGPIAAQVKTAAYCAVQDVRAAMRYLAANAEAFGGDPTQLFLGGDSAGAIATLHAATVDQAEAEVYFAPEIALAGGPDNSGNDLPINYVVRGVINNCGAIFNTALLGGGEGVPVISFHDQFDCVVPYAGGNVLSCLGCSAFPYAQGSSSIHSWCAQNGVCTELNTLQNSLLHCSWPALNIIRRSACFMKRTLCGVCTSADNSNTNTYSPCMDLAWPQEDPGICAADINADGSVNAGDLLIFLSAYGLNCE